MKHWVQRISWGHWIAFGVFFLVIGYALLSQGMFMDGLLYADVSLNLAEGSSSWWNLKITNTLHNPFYEHPPLAFWIQHVWYRIFGDHLIIDKLHSVLMFILTSLLIIRLWKETGGEKGASWIPVLLFAIIPVVGWSATNNLLEGTMMVFTTSAILLSVLAVNRAKPLLAILAGIMVFLAVLTKGLVGLFPLSFFFWAWCFKREYQLKHGVRDTLLILLGTAGPLGLLFLHGPASHFIQQYLEVQVENSLLHIATVERRTFILEKFLMDGAIPIVVMWLIALMRYKNPTTKKWPMGSPETFIILAVCLSGVIPIMISMKQRVFYLLPVMPLLAVAIGLVFPHVSKDIAITLKRRAAISAAVSVLIWTGAASIAVSFRSNLVRDAETIPGVIEVCNIVPKGSGMDISSDLISDWGTHGYFWRYGRVSLHTLGCPECFYLLGTISKQPMSLDSTCTRIPLRSERFVLYRRNIQAEAP